MNQNWFEMHNVRRRLLNRAVWIPLRSSQIIETVGKSGYEGYREEFYGVGTLAVHSNTRVEAGNLRWMEVGSNRSQDFYFDSDVYVPSDTYRQHKGLLLGIHLVLQQHINSEENPEWHLHQDFVIALKLLREGDKWICPNEGFVDVARLNRNADGRPCLLEVKAEFLRDYLCAREMALYASSYRSRVEVIEDASHVEWPNNSKRDSTDSDLWEGNVIAIHEGGMPFGEEIYVSHVSRTDVDPLEDVPSFSFPTDDKISHKSWTQNANGKKLFCIQGELWRNEWVEPGEHSPRVRGDELTATVHFITDETGNKESQDTLTKGIRWLWFMPDVMMALAHRRGGALGWYTRDTGCVRCSPDYDTHFGINRIGLINVYAKDIGMLPEWQQRVWAGYNVTPEGSVSEELLASQMKADPARTRAPEALLKSELERLDQASMLALGAKLFRDHEQSFDIFQRCHRFRAVDDAGLFALAKDLTRVIADRIDVQLLQKRVSPPKGEKWGSLRFLEKTLATIIDATDAHRVLSHLVGINELRQADAHPKGSEIDEAYKLVGIDSTHPLIHQGYQMLNVCVSCIQIVAEILISSIKRDRTSS